MSTSIERSTASRRTFLQRVALGGLAAGPGSALLAACAGGGGDDQDPDTTGSTDDGSTEAPGAEADNPFGLDPEGEVEIFIFDGGFGDAYATDIHEPLLQSKWPNLTIVHNKDAHITGALQSRFVAGDPPDFVNNSGAGQMDTATLVANGQLTDLTPLFDAPSWDDPNVPVRDTLIPGTIEQGTFDKPYVLNYAFTVFGFWYDKTLFDSNGWAPPRTWAEMLDLCEEIQGAGIAPFTYPGGIAPRYFHWPLLSMAATLAGPEILVDIDNLVEGAWRHEAILEAANALRGLRESGYFLEGSEGLSHIQSQVQWALGKVAFVSCGTWLENEVAKSFEDPALQEEHELNPDDELSSEFEFAMAPYPLLSEDAAMPVETVFARRRAVHRPVPGRTPRGRPGVHEGDALHGRRSRVHRAGNQPDRGARLVRRGRPGCARTHLRAADAQRGRHECPQLQVGQLVPDDEQPRHRRAHRRPAGRPQDRRGVGRRVRGGGSHHPRGRVHPEVHPPPDRCR